MRNAVNYPTTHLSPPNPNVHAKFPIKTRIVRDSVWRKFGSNSATRAKVFHHSLTANSVAVTLSHPSGIDEGRERHIYEADRFLDDWEPAL